MRQMISAMVAAVAVMAAAPAMACGDRSCAEPQGDVAPAPTYGYSSCSSGCGSAHGRLADPARQYHADHPVQRYYYVNQGPTYTGPGNWVPVPTYQESAVSGWNAYSRPYYYGYNGGPYANAANHYYDGAGIEGPAVYTYRPHRHYRPWRPRSSYYPGPRALHRYY
ncbi:hypothetical protein [Bradyrhizobium sp.]|uniref:hypothetical protein n=1 Tax=Bradyrhizobium sp. TaxID=376 RepID=UPI003C768ED2